MRNPFSAPKALSNLTSLNDYQPMQKCSAIIAEPTEKFLEYIRLGSAKEGLKFEEIYFEEENPVILIPSIGSFSSEEDFDRYLETQKEIWMKRFFGAFGMGVPAGGPAVFDTYFKLKIRDHVFDER